MALRARKEVEERFLDVDASMSGTLTFKEPVNLRINGRFEGTLESKGNLHIGPKAFVDAHISGDNITVAGRVKGDIVARDKLMLEASADVRGEVKTARLIVFEGAIFEGKCHMLEDILNVEDLARYLEVDTSSVLEWATSGKVPAFKEADAWHFDRKKIDEWVASGKIK
ncbi:MAG: polymer-forming cytoskeletal protein [Candidatus Omnitrophota bacterium]